MEVGEEELAYPVEALEVLKDRDEEALTHEQKIALENLSRHTRVRDLDTLSEIYEELEEIDDLKDRHIYKLLEIVPVHESTLRAIFSKERIKLDDSDVEAILKVCRSVEVED